MLPRSSGVSTRCSAASPTLPYTFAPPALLPGVAVVTLDPTVSTRARSSSVILMGSFLLSGDIFLLAALALGWFARTLIFSGSALARTRPLLQRSQIDRPVCQRPSRLSIYRPNQDLGEEVVSDQKADHQHRRVGKHRKGDSQPFWCLLVLIVLSRIRHFCFVVFECSHRLRFSRFTRAFAAFPVGHGDLG